IATRARLNEAIAAPLERIATTITATLQQASLTPAQIGTVFMTGGSSNLPALHALVAQILPHTPIATGDMFGSVGTGLALDAAARFA
ncbi:MAG: Hsp70 family protein, partial [Paracoccaceae bacterium]